MNRSQYYNPDPETFEIFSASSGRGSSRVHPICWLATLTAGWAPMARLRIGAWMLNSW